MQSAVSSTTQFLCRNRINLLNLTSVTCAGDYGVEVWAIIYIYIHIQSVSFTRSVNIDRCAVLIALGIHLHLLHCVSKKFTLFVFTITKSDVDQF